jgi:ABC-type antimicrobial peptide transport system ATPase subunit
VIGMNGSDMPLLEISDLTVTIGSGQNALTAVRGIDLTLRRGESLGVVGESGAGCCRRAPASEDRSGSTGPNWSGSATASCARSAGPRSA